MKALARPAAAAILTCLISSVSHAATFIDFETYPDGTAAQVGDTLYLQYAPQGIVFDFTPPSLRARVLDQAHTQVVPHSPSLAAEDQNFGLETFMQTEFDITFTSRQRLVSFWGGSDRCTTGRLTAFDDVQMLISDEHPMPSGQMAFFSVSVPMAQISRITFQALGPGCDETIDDLTFDGEPAPTPTTGAPVVTVGAPSPGNHDFTNQDFGVFGSAQGTNLTPQVTLTLTSLDTPSGQPSVQTFYLTMFSTGSTNYSFGTSKVIGGGLPIGRYQLVASVSDLFGRTAQDTVDFTNIPDRVTSHASGHPELGTFLYAVPEDRCQMLIYTNGAVSLDKAQNVVPVDLSQPIAAKWLAVRSPMLAGDRSLGCANGNSSSVEGWTVQAFARGRIYLSPSGQAIFTTTQLAKAVRRLAAGIGGGNAPLNLSDEFHRIGTPVADPGFDLEVDDPTWMFQRFDRDGFGPGFQNTLEIRGRDPILYAELVGGNLYELAAAGLSVNTLTPTLWSQAACAARQIGGMWPGECDYDDLVPPLGSGLMPQSGDSNCGFEAWPLAPEWAPIPDNQTRVVYEGIIKQFDGDGPDPGSHIANEDWRGTHQTCIDGGIEDTSIDALGIAILCPNPLGLLFSGGEACGDVVDDIKEICRSDWTMHTRPTPGKPAPLTASNAASNDFEIEFEADWARDYFKEFQPLSGDFVQVRGRPIVDCGHVTFNGEIHPADTTVAIRSSSDATARVTHAFIWANAFFTTGSMTYTIYAPPRPSPTHHLVVFKNETSYFKSRNVTVETTPVSGGMRITLAPVNLSDVEVDTDENQWIYPDDRTNFAEFVDHWMLLWAPAGVTFELPNI